MVAEFIIGAVITVNAVMLFILSESLEKFLYKSFTLNSVERLWVVMGVEHAIFAALIIIKIGIPDMPRKIRKMLIRTQIELNDLPGLGDSARIAELEAEIEDLKKHGGKSEKERAIDII